MEEISNLKIMAESDDTVDRISELPPFIIHHIMSYLSATEVAQTSILSKRWYYLRTSFPILDFDQTPFIKISVHPSSFLFWRTQKSFCEGVKNFLRFVDVSVDRFCEQKICMQKFRLFISLLKVRRSSAFVDKWLGLAVKSGVKELDVNVITDKQRMYTMPQIFFSAKSVTALKLGYCKLDLPLETIIRFHSLRKLTLEEVYINEQMVQKLASDCPLLEDLFLKHCWGLKSYCIYKACNLKILEIDLSIHHQDVERIEIAVPSLHQFTLLSAILKTPLMIEMAGCPNLKILNLSGLRFTDQYFHGLISKFPLLEELSVCSCRSLKTVIISSIRLKNLYLGYCQNLKALEVDAPNLLSFSYVNNPIPCGSINAPCPWEVKFENKGDLGTSWYLDMKEFLGQSNLIKVLSLDVWSGKISFNLDEFRESSPSLPFEVEKLCVCVTNVPPSSVSALFDGIFGMCYFRTLSVVTDKAVCSKFIEWVYVELKIGDPSCCNSHTIKCWRHYLKVVNIESSVSSNDQKPPEVYSLMDAWPVLKGTLQCQLGWCLDKYTS